MTISSTMNHTAVLMSNLAYPCSQPQTVPASITMGTRTSRTSTNGMASPLLLRQRAPTTQSLAIARAGHAAAAQACADGGRGPSRRGSRRCGDCRATWLPRLPWLRTRRRRRDRKQYHTTTPLPLLGERHGDLVLGGITLCSQEGRPPKRHTWANLRPYHAHPRKCQGRIRSKMSRTRDRAARLNHHRRGSPVMCFSTDHE
jgi:hypothetical protein